MIKNILLSLCLILPIFAKEHLYKNLSAYALNSFDEFEKKRVWLNYSDEKDIFVLYYRENIVHTIVINIDKKKSNTLKFAISKYKEWKKKAIEKKVKIKKTITNIQINNGYLKMYSNQFDLKPFDITLDFFSKSKTEHGIVFVFNKTFARSNRYIDHKPNPLHFSSKNVSLLENALQKNSMNTFKKELVKQKNIESDFK